VSPLRYVMAVVSKECVCEVGSMSRNGVVESVYLARACPAAILIIDDIAARRLVCVDTEVWRMDRWSDS